MLEQSDARKSLSVRLLYSRTPKLGKVCNICCMCNILLRFMRLFGAFCSVVALGCLKTQKNAVPDLNGTAFFCGSI